MKVCFKCKEEKELTEFYVHPQMKDGHLGKCKSCSRSDTREYNRNNKRHLQEYDRAREKTDKRKKQKAMYQSAHRKNCPGKYKARTATANAIRDGRLIKGPCVECGSMFTQAHHEDYSKPLEVIWYCKQCHPITGR